eukprot:6268060-Ditylum_brightwellii.AAC.1
MEHSFWIIATGWWHDLGISAVLIVAVVVELRINVAVAFLQCAVVCQESLRLPSEDGGLVVVVVVQLESDSVGRPNYEKRLKTMDE